jgi:ketosteroid isomerase-like protein
MRSTSLVAGVTSTLLLIGAWSSINAAPAAANLFGFFGSEGRADDRALIAAARAAQNAAIAAGDLDRAASFWTDDVTVRRGLGAAVSGRSAAVDALRPAGSPASHVIYQRIARDIDVSAKWPLAFETGRWEGHAGSVTGPTSIAGRYSAQWVKRSGQWLIRSEVFVALTCSGAGCESSAVP